MVQRRFLYYQGKQLRVKLLFKMYHKKIFAQYDPFVVFAVQFSLFWHNHNQGAKVYYKFVLMPPILAAPFPAYYHSVLSGSLLVA